MKKILPFLIVLLFFLSQGVKAQHLYGKDLQLPPVVAPPSPTTSFLYNVGGTLYWAGSPVATGATTVTYPPAGIPLSTGSAWGPSITNNSSNWNTAFLWGNWATDSANNVRKWHFDNAGDLLVGTGNNTYTTLPKGANRQVLKVESGIVGWSNDSTYNDSCFNRQADSIYTKNGTDILRTNWIRSFNGAPNYNNDLTIEAYDPFNDPLSYARLFLSSTIQAFGLVEVEPAVGFGIIGATGGTATIETNNAFNNKRLRCMFSSTSLSSGNNPNVQLEYENIITYTLKKDTAIVPIVKSTNIPTLGSTPTYSLVTDASSGVMYKFSWSPGMTYSAGYRIGVSGTSINNLLYQKDIDTVKTSLNGLLTATGGVLSTTPDNHSNWDAAYSHKTTEDALSGILKCNGAGAYTTVTDNSTNWNNAYSHKTTEDALNGYVSVNGVGSYSANTTPLRKPTIEGNLTICSGGSTTLDAGRYTSYSWSTGTTLQALTISPTVNTTYTVTVTDVNGLTGTNSATVTVSAARTASISFTQDSYIWQENTLVFPTLVGTAGGTYTVSTPGLSINESDGGIDLGTGVGGIYVIKYTLAATIGCPAVTAQCFFYPSFLPIPSITGDLFINSGSTTTLTCNPNTGVLPVTYSWSTGATSASISGVSSGTYTVTVVEQSTGYNQTETAIATVVSFPPGTSSAAQGISFFMDDTHIITIGTNNDHELNTLSKVPVTATPEQLDAISVTAATSPVEDEAYLYNTALNRTTIDAGVWTFNTYASVNSTAGGRISSIKRSVFCVGASLGAINITTSGTGTTRTVNATAGSWFVSGDAGATRDISGYLQTPQGLYQITAYHSATSVDILTPSTYANESNVSAYKWKYLFQAESPTITAIGTNYTLYTYDVAQPAFTVITSDKLGEISFGVSNNTTTVNYTHNGTTHYTNFQSPLITLHNNLAGLQGGTTNEYYHLTSAQATQVAALPDILNSTGTSTTKGISQAAAKNEIDSTVAVPKIWCAITAAYTGTTTCTLTGNQVLADQMWGSLFTCLSSADAGKHGYIASAIYSTGVITLTVYGDVNLASGDKSFYFAPNLKITAFEKYFRYRGVIYADASNPFGAEYQLNAADSNYVIDVSVFVKTAAAGAGASMGVNLYAGASNLFSSAIDLATGTSSLHNQPNTTIITNSLNFTARVTASAGATNYASDLQIRCYVIPTRHYYAK